MTNIKVKVVNRGPQVTIREAVPGPQGPPGPSGGSVITYEAGENISAGRAVILEAGKAIYFQPSDIDHAGRVLGITITSAIIGQDVSVQLSGVVSDPAFVFTADMPIFVRDDGALYATPGSSGIVQQVGAALSVNTIYINISHSIVR